MRVSNMAIDLGRFLVTLTSILAVCLGADTNMDQCSYSFWDNKSEAPTVKNVRVACSEGAVNWNAPTGALWVTMQFHTPSQPFRACFKATAQYTHAKISRIAREKETDGRKVIEITTLKGAKSPGVASKEVCFDSAAGEKIVLFIEASADAATTGKISIAYDLERISRERISREAPRDRMEDCRPCTDEEILDSFCTSDFVVVGTLEKVQRRESADESEIQLLVRKIHHQKTRQFKRDTHTRGSLRGQVIVPSKCGARAGSGEFLITGKIRLDRALLHCAPRIEDWNRIKEEATKTGNTFCSLD